jgi:hypothetical protein
MVYIRFFWQGFYQIYGHIRCIYTVLANPTYTYIQCTYGFLAWKSPNIQCTYTYIYSCGQPYTQIKGKKARHFNSGGTFKDIWFPVTIADSGEMLLLPAQFFSIFPPSISDIKGPNTELNVISPLSAFDTGTGFQDTQRNAPIASSLNDVGATVH